MKIHKLIIGLSFLINFLSAQDFYFTKNAKIHFKSNTPLEIIEGINNSATSVVDAAKGTIEYGLLLKSFIFDRALLQEHFHENYLESEKYPKAKFTGMIDNFAKINKAKEGDKKVKVKGKLTIHGVTKDITTDVDVKFSNNGIVSTYTKFIISPEDYGIKIPSVVREKIAKNISIEVTANYQVLNKK